MQRNRLLIIGVIVLAVGAVASITGGIGEVRYIQCVAAPSSQCNLRDAQYVTDFLANSDLLSVGLNFVLVGIIIAVAGIITNYMARLSNELKPRTSTIPACPKCGAQITGTAKFCANCGNKLGE